MNKLIHVIASLIACVLAFVALTLLTVIVLVDTNRLATGFLFPLVSKHSPVHIAATYFRLTPLGTLATSNLTVKLDGMNAKIEDLYVEMSVWSLVKSGFQHVDAAKFLVRGADIKLLPDEEVVKPASKRDQKAAPISTDPSKIVVSLTQTEILESNISSTSKEGAFSVTKLNLLGKNLEYPGPIDLKGSSEVALDFPSSKLKLTTHCDVTATGTVENDGAHPLAVLLKLTDMKGAVGMTSLDDRTLSLEAHGDVLPKSISLPKIKIASSSSDQGAFSVTGSTVVRFDGSGGEVKFDSLAANASVVRSFYNPPWFSRLDFQGEAHGSYAWGLQQKADVDLQFSTLLIAGSKNYDTSAVRATYEKSKGSWAIRHGAIELKTGEKLLTNLTVDYEVPDKDAQSLLFHSDIFDADLIQAIASEFKTKPLATTSAADSSALAPSTLPDAQSSEGHIDLPDIKVEGSISSLTIEKNDLSDLKISAHSSKDGAEISSFTANGGNGTFRSKGTLSADGALNAKAEVAHITIEELSKRLSKGNTDSLVTGSIDGARVTVIGDQIFKSKFMDRISGTFQSNYSNIKLPSRFQDVPPINLIFLPFKVFGKVVGTFGNFILPESVSSAGGAISNALGEQGRLYLDQGKLDLSLKNGTVHIPFNEINANLLPTLEMEGDIGLNGDLDLVTRIKLAGVRIPLTIGGTVNLPLPNIKTFIPELIRSVGLSVTGIVGGLMPFLDEGEKVPPRELDRYLNSLASKLPTPTPVPTPE